MPTEMAPLLASAVQKGLAARVPEKVSVALVASVVVVKAPTQLPLLAATEAHPLPQLGAPTRSQGVWGVLGVVALLTRSQPVPSKETRALSAQVPAGPATSGRTTTVPIILRTPPDWKCTLQIYG